MFYLGTTDNRVVQGEEKELSYVLRDEAREAIDLTDKSVYIKVRRYKEAGTILIDDGACVLSADPTDGTVTYTVTAALTATWDEGNYLLRIKTEDASTGYIEQSDVYVFQVIRSL